MISIIDVVTLILVLDTVAVLSDIKNKLKKWLNLNGISWTIKNKLYGVVQYVVPLMELLTTPAENVRKKENQKIRLINYGNIIFFKLLSSTYYTDY